MFQVSGLRWLRGLFESPSHPRRPRLNRPGLKIKGVTKGGYASEAGHERRPPRFSPGKPLRSIEPGRLHCRVPMGQ
jgi:hypothetical protein